MGKRKNDSNVGFVTAAFCFVLGWVGCWRDPCVFRFVRLHYMLWMP